MQSPQGGDGALGVAHGQQAPHSHATEVLGCPGRLQATGRRGPGVPCTLQGTCRATSRSGSCWLPHGSTKGALSGKKTATPKHTLPDRLQTAVVITRKSLGPSTTASISGFSPKTCISPMCFLDIHSRERETPKKCWESCQCCRCVFQLSGNVQLPQGTTHLCDYFLGQTKSSWWPLHHHPCPSWAMTRRTVLSCNFPGWLKDQQVLSPWGQGCKSSQDQG